MEVLLVLSALVGLAFSYEPILVDYLEEYGIPRFNEIKAAEEAVKDDARNNRIYGGTTANAGDQPHLVGLVIHLTDGRQAYCGSSMLSNTRAVTAAHCWKSTNLEARQFTLVFGSATLTFGGTRVDTSDVEMHNDYNPGSSANDIAMIKFSFVGYTNTINRVLLPSGNRDYAGVWATAAGFGTSKEGLGTKRRVNLQVISNDECRKTYGNTITSRTLCTNSTGGQSTCFGDSGGPLAIGRGNNRQLIGVTSFIHIGGCESGYPAGFIRVTSYRPWIQARM